MKAKVLLIRADASERMGNGHIMQCIALAQEWRKRGGTVALVSKELNPNLVDRLIYEHIDTYEIADDRTDALKTVALATFLGADWLVIDGYQFDAGYQSVVVEHARAKVLAINEQSGSAATVDILLNQNSWAKPEGNTWAHTQLLGSKYALLRNEFLLIGQNEGVKHPVTKVFVGAGGTDSANMKERLSNIVAKIGWEVEDNYTLGMATSDMAISAGGGTCRELAYLGTPSILFTVADNQRMQVEDLSNRGIAISIGPAEYLTDWQIWDALLSLAGDKDRRKQMSLLGQELIDGCGAERIVKEMLNGLG